MPHLTFPMSDDGLALDVLIGLDGAASHACVAAGQPVPVPLQVKALIDSGCDPTAVSQSVLNALGLLRGTTATTHTAAGLVQVEVFQVSLSIYGPDGTSGPSFNAADWKVTALPQPIPGIDVLLGLDLLRQCLLIVDGPGKKFTLSF